MGGSTSIAVTDCEAGFGRRAAVTTLGCKVNVYESNLIAQRLSQDQWVLVDDSQMADLYVINSCTVTKEADRQTRQQIRRAIRKNPSAMVVVTGCYAQMNPEEIAEIEGVSLVVGNDRKLFIPDIIRDGDRHGDGRIVRGSQERDIGLPPDLLSGYEGQTRAFVQVQQGCDQSCTFCVIHKARGPSRSFDVSGVLQQVRSLVNNGYREIVICGVDLGSYENEAVIGAREQENTRLVQLLETVAGLSGDFRIRLSSIDPAHISDELLDLLSSAERFCPYLHVSMQSGCTLILKRMKRRYSSEVLYERLTSARERVSDLVLGADVMVGFPTEREEHFEQTLAAVRDLQIIYPHVFSYSARAGTPASRIPAQVLHADRRRRSALIRAEGERNRRHALQSWIGRGARVLVERQLKSTHSGYNARLPNYMPVRVDSGKAEAGRFLDVHVTGVESNTLIAELSPR